MLSFKSSPIFYGSIWHVAHMSDKLLIIFLEEVINMTSKFTGNSLILINMSY